MREVAQGLLVDREEAAGGPVLGGHVGDGRPVGHAQTGEPRTEVLHEPAHHADAAQQLGDGQHQVGGGGAGAASAAGEPHAHHVGDAA